MYSWIGRVTGGTRLRRLTRVAMALPQPVMYAVVTMGGYVAFVLARGPRRTILRNMTALLPALSAAKRRWLCARYFVQECLTIYEQAVEYRRGLLGEGLGGRRGRVAFDVTGLAHLDAALTRGRGAIVVTPHVGNYFYFFWWLSQRYTCLTVATMGSPDIRPLYLGFEALGLRGFDYDNDPPLLIYRRLRTLLRNNGVVFLMGDFARPGFPHSRLLGRPSGFPAGPVSLAIDSGAALIPLEGARVTWRRHRMRFMPAIDPALDTMADAMSAIIGRVPDQWLYWFNIHDRWRVWTEPAAAPERGSRRSVHTRTPQMSSSRTTRRPAERT